MRQAFPLYQQSLQDAIVVEGIGIHRGKPVRLYLRPAPADTGIVFRRIDLDQNIQIPLDVHHITSTWLATTIGIDQVEIQTVEHLISALIGLGVDNVCIEVDGPEIPIFDGSSGPFVQLIRDTGTRFQPVEKKVWLPTKTTRCEEDDKWIQISPHSRYEIQFTIQFDHPAIGTQSFDYIHQPDTYEMQIAHARTFGFVAEVEQLRAAGLALGGDFENAVVLGEDSVLNQGGLRYNDEFVRHKILDLIGDVGFIGGQIMGRIEAYKSGHTLNRALVKKMIDDNAIMMTTLSQAMTWLSQQDQLAAAG